MVHLKIVFRISSEAANEIRPGEWPSAPPAVVLRVLLPADRKWLPTGADNAALLLRSAVLLEPFRTHRPSTRNGTRGNVVGNCQEHVVRFHHTLDVVTRNNGAAPMLQ